MGRGSGEVMRRQDLPRSVPRPYSLLGEERDEDLGAAVVGVEEARPGDGDLLGEHGLVLEEEQGLAAEGGDEGRPRAGESIVDGRARAAGPTGEGLVAGVVGVPGHVAKALDVRA